MLFYKTNLVWYRNYHFYIQTSLFIISFVSLSWHFWFLVFNTNLTDSFYPPYSDTDRLAWDFFCFWSMQSTLMVMIYSLLNTIYYLFRNASLKWVTNFNWRNFINIALIIAMLSYYLTVLIDSVPYDDPKTKFYYVQYWIPTHIQHAVLPLLMLIYTFLTPVADVSLKRYLTRNFFFYWAYVLFYAFIVLIRGHILHITNYGVVRAWPWYYPYFFFNIRGEFPKGGWYVFIGAFLIFMVIFLALGSLLIYINNLIFVKIIKTKRAL